MVVMMVRTGVVTRHGEEGGVVGEAAGGAVAALAAGEEAARLAGAIAHRVHVMSGWRERRQLTNHIAAAAAAAAAIAAPSSRRKVVLPSPGPLLVLPQMVAMVRLGWMAAPGPITSVPIHFSMPRRWRRIVQWRWSGSRLPTRKRILCMILALMRWWWVVLAWRCRSAAGRPLNLHDLVHAVLRCDVRAAPRKGMCKHHGCVARKQ